MATITRAVPHPRRIRRIWWPWTVATAAGEVLGFAAPAIVGAVLLWLIGGPDTGGRALGFYAALIAAGAVEGAVLGTAQARVLGRVLPSVSRRDWVGATAAAAAFAWSLGMLPSTVDAFVPLPTAVMIGAWVVLAVPLLGSIGAGQWLVLRRHVAGSGRWVTANVLGWLLGLPVTFIGPALVPNGSPPAVWAAVFIVCGLLMGAIVGGVTGGTLQRLLDERQSNRPPAR